MTKIIWSFFKTIINSGVSMKIGLMGLPMCGKKTLFKLLTGNSVEVLNPEKQESIPGKADIRDRRFNELVELFQPKKETPARIDVELLPDLDKRIIQEGKIFTDIALYDALCLVIRSFSDDSVYHPSGTVCVERDFDEITGELILHDMIFIEKRLERIADSEKKGKGQMKPGEKELLLRFKEHMESDKPLRTCILSSEENKIIHGYPLITLKEMLVVVNCSDEDLNSKSIIESLIDKHDKNKVSFIQVCAALENEIEDLDTEEDRIEFMKVSGIVKPALNLLTKILMKSLGLISYFTVGKDEVRQWLVNDNATAPEAARVIHSDIERGFIRAEVIRFEDMQKLRNEEAVKSAGKQHVMGKDYHVQDGDIISFRFNV
ncbi:DUF933 domain-containing protein [Spirochaetota bacterium]